MRSLGSARRLAWLVVVALVAVGMGCEVGSSETTACLAACGPAGVSYVVWDRCQCNQPARPVNQDGGR